MAGQFWLKLKSQRHLLVLLVVVVVFQLLLAQASSYVLADRNPPLSIAVQNIDGSAQASELVDGLSTISGLDVVSVDNSLSSEVVFAQNVVQGLLVIPDGFGNALDQGKRLPVVYRLAPGITNYAFAREQIADVILQMRAKHALQVALGSLSAADNQVTLPPTGDLLDVAYDGPGTPIPAGSPAPVHGVSALLLLLAFLHAALTVPSHQDKRLLVHGRRAYLRQLVISLTVVWLVWTVVILLYLAFMALLLGAAPDLWCGLGFLAVVLYVSLLGSLAAQLFGHHATTWLFLPLFLLSMTIGGGLWAESALPAWCSPVVPVVAVSAVSGTDLTGVTVLLVAALVVAGLLLVAASLRVAVRSE
ncbi:MAG: hypothetical protein FWF71_06875 [Actinomycetia bacterium]|nr:hypothetical protein [Actinomycetes bacterium]